MTQNLTLFPITDSADPNQKQSRRMVNNRRNNIDHDFYPTPPIATIAILKHESFIGGVWEPACGDGAMSEVLISHGYDVLSSDLIDRGYGKPGVNFLRSSMISDNIMTNPPFKHGNKFIHQALTHARNKVVFLMRLNYLASQGRKKFFGPKSPMPFARVYIHSKRIPFGPSTMMDFAWYVWDREHVGKPTMEWI